MYLLILSIFFSQLQPQEILWNLRAGNDSLYNASLPAISLLYLSSNQGNNLEIGIPSLLEKILNGDRSLIPLLASLFISKGDISLAEYYWKTAGKELPATRIELLELLAWFGRFKLYSLLSLHPSAPLDMENTQYSNDCAAICAIGWMRPRADGLFHGEQLVSEEDIQVLFNCFPEIDSSQTNRTFVSLELFVKNACNTGGSY